MLAKYQSDFIDFVLEADVLRFGEFTLKSGRVSPYFFNAGAFNTGSLLSRLGGFYAQALVESGTGFDVLFGPAYKGIPLVCSAAIAMGDLFGQDVPYAFNRKEAKDHGEGGQLVGAALQGRAVIVDDVITAGTAIREAMQLLGQTGAEVTGILVAIDRQEKGLGELSAIQEVEQEYGVSVTSIVKLEHIVEHLATRETSGKELELLNAYRSRYGIGN